MEVLIALFLATLIACFFSEHVIQAIAAVNRQLFVAVFSDPKVQNAIFTPLNNQMETMMVNTMGPALIASNNNPEVIDSIPNLMLSPKMTSHLHECLISLLERKEMLQNFQELMCNVIASDEFQACFIHAFSGAISDPITRRAILNILIEGLQDEELHQKIAQGALQAVEEGLNSIGKDDKLKNALKEIVLESLRDEELHNAAVQGAMGAVKTGIKEALLDPELRDIFKGALKESLQDEDIHKATMKGAMDAIFPWAKSKDSKEKEKESSSSKA